MSHEMRDSYEQYKDDLSSMIAAYGGQDSFLVIPRVYIDFFGSMDTALFFNQCVYWSDRTSDPERWFYKTYNEWYEELGLSEYQVRKAAKTAQDYLATDVRKARGNPTVHYQVQWHKFSVSLVKFLRKRNPKNFPLETVKTKETIITENTPKTTTENSTQEEEDKSSIHIQAPLGVEVLPDWYSDLMAIRGFKFSLPHCQAWLDEKGITLERANITAADLKGKWPGPKSRPYVDAWATFRAWVQRPPLPQRRDRATRPEVSSNPNDFSRF